MQDNIFIIKSDVSTLKSDVVSIKIELVEFKDNTKQKFGLVMDFLSRTEGELMKIKKEIAGVKDGSILTENMVDIEKRVAFLEQEVVEIKIV